MKDVSPGPGGGRVDAPLVLAPDKDPSLDPTKKKDGTGNWLVDAMDKKSDRSQQGRGARNRDEPTKGDPDLLKGDDRRGDPDSAFLGEDREKAGPREQAEQVYNPLDSFMGGWVSARDHDLLLPSSKGDGLSVAGLDRTHSDTLPGLDLGQTGAPGEGLFAAPEGAGPGDRGPGPNPYLSALDLTPSPQVKAFFSLEGSGSNPFGLPDLSSGVSTLGSPEKASEGTRTYVPDFALPPDDDKYFKQMKRF
jgi:hypothetical protein